MQLLTLLDLIFLEKERTAIYPDCPFLEPVFPVFYNDYILYDTIQSKVVYREDKVDMSIIMSLIGKDGIVLATDSRTTWQKHGFTYHNDNAKSCTNSLIILD